MKGGEIRCLSKGTEEKQKDEIWRQRDREIKKDRDREKDTRVKVVHGRE